MGLLSVCKSYIPNRWKRKVKLFIRNVVQSIQYYLFRKILFTSKPTGIKRYVFVCKGNVCRSAYAEVASRIYYADDCSLSFESCGIDVDQGDFPPPDAVCVAREDVASLLKNRKSKSLEECDLVNADIILPMEYEQYLYLINAYPHYAYKIRLLREFAPGCSSLFCNIDDPYSWGKAEFKKTFSLIDRAIKKLR